MPNTGPVRSRRHRFVPAMVAAGITVVAAGVGIRHALLAGDSREVAARFLSVQSEELSQRPMVRNLPSFRRPTHDYVLLQPVKYGLEAATVKVDAQDQYVASCTWRYATPAKGQLSQADAASTAESLLQRMSPFYRADLPIAVHPAGNTDKSGDCFEVSQNALHGDLLFLLGAKVDGQGRPVAYRASAVRPPPPPSSSVRVAQEDALATVKADFAKRPKAIVEQMEVVSLSTRSFYAPEGEPVYVVRTRGRDDTGRTGLLRYRTWVIDRGVHATTGELLTVQTFPDEYYWRRSERPAR